MLKSLSDRIKVHTNYLKKQIKEEKFIESLLDLLRETPLWAKIGEDHLSINDRWGFWWTLTINAKIDVQEVEDAFCRVIRQKYGNTWDMKVDYNSVLLKTQFAYPLDFRIEITNPDIPDCKVVKIPIRTLTDTELEAQRVTYQYLIECNGKERM